MMAQPEQHQELTETVVKAVQEARRLAAQQDDEREPYRSCYAAADLLQRTAATVEEEAASSQAAATAAANSATESAAAAPPASEAAAASAAALVARCQLERGLVLLETDLTADGQAALEAGLAHAWPEDDLPSLEVQQQAHNALAGLWCERSEHATALQHLQTATALHTRICALQQQQQQDADVASSSPSSSAAAGGSSWQQPLYDAGQVERSYTTTLFFLAQVHGHLGDKQASAAYCAATLNRQLQLPSEELDLNDWVQNCLQLSGFFLDCNAFGLSEYCCAAVQALLLRELAKQPPAPAACSSSECDASHDGKDQAGKQQQQQAVECTPTGAATPTGATAPAAAGKGAPTPSAKAQQQPGSAVDGDEPAGDDAPPPELLAALRLLDADVSANVCLAQAKRRLYCLVASHEAHVEGRSPATPFDSPAAVPAVLRFDALPGLPALAELPWGAAALAGSYEAALALVRGALPWFRRALDHYALDGWVTEHVSILFEMSNLHRCLAGFVAQDDDHRRCVLHRLRVKLLAPLEGELSPTHYPGLSRSISLELGNVWREVAGIKESAGRPAGKVAAAMRAAVGHYRLFLDSFRGADGALPGSVEAEMEQHYLGALFSTARMLRGCIGGGSGSSSSNGGKPPSSACPDTEVLRQGAGLLDELVAYVERNGVASWQQHADMAGQMAELLRERLSLLDVSRGRPSGAAAAAPSTQQHV